MMRRFPLALPVFLASIAIYACHASGSDATDSESSASSTDPNEAGASTATGNTSDASSSALTDPACAADTDDPPSSLSCTGLYADIGAKTIAPAARQFTPVRGLWSDGAQKRRFISLPDGQQIDNTDSSEWNFPVGTKAWKEFSMEGRLVETRYFHKQSAGYWTYATYEWSADQSSAKRSGGGPVTLPSGNVYQVPTHDECTQCHRGRTDNLLGFEHVSLGMQGATGVTLATLVAEKRLKNPPSNTSLTIGDDGTGAAAPALLWIHVNCGNACHNANSNSIGYAAGMRLRLDPDKLDGQSTSGFDIPRTTIGVTVDTPQWSGDTRIVAGDPQNSLLLQLISRREADNQMPPLATDIVDQDGITAVTNWISGMPKVVTDAGASDAGPATDGGDAGAPVDAAAD